MNTHTDKLLKQSKEKFSKCKIYPELRTQTQFNEKKDIIEPLTETCVVVNKPKYFKFCSCHIYCHKNNIKLRCYSNCE